jgi:hypothetical protein
MEYASVGPVPTTPHFCRTDSRLQRDLTIRKLRRTTDFQNLTFRIGGYTEHDQGRFYHLWKNGEVLSIQAEPYRRQGIDYSDTSQCWSTKNFSSDKEAYFYLQEVLQTMLDTLQFGTENNWAHLVRQKVSAN